MTDNEIISFSLNMWANYIETGNVTLSEKDIIERGSEKEKLKLQSRILDIDQKEMVKRIRKLSLKHFEDKL